MFVSTARRLSDALRRRPKALGYTVAVLLGLDAAVTVWAACALISGVQQYFAG